MVDFDPFSTTQSTAMITDDFTLPTIRTTQNNTPRVIVAEMKKIVMYPMQLAINKYATIVLVSIGLPSNIMCFILWRRPALWHVSGLYMAGLALSDILALLLNMLKDLHSVWEVCIMNTAVTCFIFPTLLNAGQQLSTYLGLGFTVERYISVFYPFQRNIYCTEERSKMVITGFIVFLLIWNCPQSYFWFLTTELDIRKNITRTYCALKKEYDEGEDISVFGIFTYITEGFSFGVISICVLVMDCFLIRQMARLANAETMRGTKRKVSTTTTTITLLAVSVYQICTTLPDTFAKSLYNVYCLKNSFNPTDEELERYRKYELVAEIAEEVRISHFTFNFYIYLITNLRFRVEFMRLIYRCFNKEYILPEMAEFYSRRHTIAVPLDDDHEEEEKPKTMYRKLSLTLQNYVHPNMKRNSKDGKHQTRKVSIPPHKEDKRERSPSVNKTRGSIARGQKLGPKKGPNDDKARKGSKQGTGVDESTHQPSPEPVEKPEPHVGLDDN
ncbi:uncharacterized protein LOC131954918 [Physella acuta]|uniref:uncharacterized protein LOC131954918 n=1 Tax=Physella acuta TaxID=109671 RepID=UPI0027DDD711|nr:uncharacterized protein LOC131954918 [Physella acuta]